MIGYVMKTYQEITSAAFINAIAYYVETLLGIDLKLIKKNRYNAPCPFHADTKDNFKEEKLFGDNRKINVGGPHHFLSQSSVEKKRLQN
jgi:hypothetical protein